MRCKLAHRSAQVHAVAQFPNPRRQVEYFGVDRCTLQVHLINKAERGGGGLQGAGLSREDLWCLPTDSPPASMHSRIRWMSRWDVVARVNIYNNEWWWLGVDELGECDAYMGSCDLFPKFLPRKRVRRQAIFPPEKLQNVGIRSCRWGRHSIPPEMEA